VDGHFFVVCSHDSHSFFLIYLPEVILIKLNP